MTVDRELTDLECQLIDECEKLINAIRSIGQDGANYAKASQIADEVEDFVTNLD